MTGDAPLTARPRGIRWPIALLAVAVLVACLAFAAAWGRDRAGTAPTDESRVGTEVLVAYAREGGIAGADLRLTVAADGDVTLRSHQLGARSTWVRQLSGAELDALRAALDRSGFHDLEADYRHAGVCNDCFVDTVTYGGRSVSVQASAVPPGLAEVLRLLRDLAADG